MYLRIHAKEETAYILRIILTEGGNPGETHGRNNSRDTNVVHHRLPFAESHKFRIRRRRNFDSAVTESTYEWISPIVYVTLWIMWWGQHWVVIEEVIMSHPHPHLDNAPHNVVQRCPYAQLTVRSRQLNLRRAIFCSWEDIYTSTRNADVISSGARKWSLKRKRQEKNSWMYK